MKATRQAYNEVLQKIRAHYFATRASASTQVTKATQGTNLSPSAREVLFAELDKYYPPGKKKRQKGGKKGKRPSVEANANNPQDLNELQTELEQLRVSEEKLTQVVDTLQGDVAAEKYMVLEYKRSYEKMRGYYENLARTIGECRSLIFDHLGRTKHTVTDTALPALLQTFIEEKMKPPSPKQEVTITVSGPDNIEKATFIQLINEVLHFNDIPTDIQPINEELRFNGSPAEVPPTHMYQVSQTVQSRRVQMARARNVYVKLLSSAQRGEHG